MTQGYAYEVAALQLFKQKAARLAGMRFFAEVKAGTARFTLTVAQGKATTASRTGPDDEAIDAMVLTFRFFIQNNEPISLSRMAQHYAKLPLSVGVVARYTNIRAQINAVLDAPPVMHLNILGDEPTNRDIIETIIYGTRAHSTAAKVARYEQWAAFPFLVPMIEHAFVDASGITILGIERAAQINDDALDELRQQGIL